MKYFIITGTSRGLGKALTEQLLQEGNTLFCISRKQSSELKNLASDKGVNLYYFSCDLQKLDDVEKVMGKIFTTIDFSNAEGIYLINNAGVIEPIIPAGKATAPEVATNIQVNLVAPMVLSTHFINYTSQYKTEKVIVNVSSGAANRPIYGWSAYCSSKAGLDMFTKAVGVEQQDEKNPVTVISFSPGVMDTDMQERIRQSDKEDFADVNQFIEYNDNGMLRSPDLVASKLLDLLFHQEIENGTVYDIKQLV